jgi:hypothetical protein
LGLTRLIRWSLSRVIDILEHDSLREQVREAWWRFDPIGVREVRSSCSDEYDGYVALTVSALIHEEDVDEVIQRSLESMGGMRWLGDDRIEGFLGELKRLQLDTNGCEDVGKGDSGSTSNRQG